MEAVSRLAAALIIAITIFIVASFAFLKYEEYLDTMDRKADINEQEVKNIAVDECLRAGKLVSQKDNGQLTEPALYYYQLCLKDKGYETSLPE